MAQAKDIPSLDEIIQAGKLFPGPPGQSLTWTKQIESVGGMSSWQTEYLAKDGGQARLE